MKQLLCTALLFCGVPCIALFIACETAKNKPAKTLLSQIEQLYDTGQYNAALDSIRALRARYPDAVTERKAALAIWQNASLKLAQDDIARTDSALQVATAAWKAAKTIRERNRLAWRRESLQVRFDALCGVVTVIHRKQGETAK